MRISREIQSLIVSRSDNLAKLFGEIGSRFSQADFEKRFIEIADQEEERLQRYAERHVRYRARNHDKILERYRQWNSENSSWSTEKRREYMREYMREYKRKNSEYFKQKRREKTLDCQRGLRYDYCRARHCRWVNPLRRSLSSADQDGVFLFARRRCG